jgi:4-hydroxy 2-oxovalerate aldolase
MKILDCTIRDGGYINNWTFSKEQVKSTYEACVKSGVEYCEIGFRRSKPDPKFGVWYHTPEDIIQETLGDVVSDTTKIVLMAQMGTFTLDDFLPRSQSLISMVRVLVPYHCKDLNDALIDTDLLWRTVEMVIKLKFLGYETTINVGRIDKLSNDQLEQCCRILDNAKPDYLYIADTYGNLGLVKMNKILDTIKNVYSGKLGFHAHDNLLNASVKTTDSTYHGVELVDGTMGGIGRGSGNAKIELLISHTVLCNQTKYNILPCLEYIDKWVVSYKKSHVLYLITGMYSIHVNYAIELMEKYNETFMRSYDILMTVYKNEKHSFFDPGYLESLVVTCKNVQQ